MHVSVPAMAVLECTRRSALPHMIRALSLCACAALPLAACAQSAAEEQGRRVVEEYTVELADPTLVRRYEGAARRGCGASEDLDFRGDIDCQSVRLTLAERELAAASARHESEIAETSRYYRSAPDAYRERWTAVWTYAQSQWRRSRDADCMEYVFAFAGASASAGEQLECLADRTFERAALLANRLGSASPGGDDGTMLGTETYVEVETATDEAPLGVQSRRAWAVWSSTGYANLRADPDINSLVVGQIADGEAVYAYECVNSDDGRTWCRVSIEGVDGWISARNLHRDGAGF